MANLLSVDQLSAAMADLPDWSGDTDSISRTLAAPSFPAAIRLVDAVADAAEEANHHPDIDIRYRAVTFRLSTHSEGGVTDRDLALARRIDTLAVEHQAS